MVAIFNIHNKNNNIQFSFVAYVCNLFKFLFMFFNDYIKLFKLFLLFYFYETNIKSIKNKMFLFLFFVCNN